MGKVRSNRCSTRVCRNKSKRKSYRRFRKSTDCNLYGRVYTCPRRHTTVKSALVCVWAESRRRTGICSHLGRCECGHPHRRSAGLSAVDKFEATNSQVRVLVSNGSNVGSQCG